MRDVGRFKLQKCGCAVLGIANWNVEFVSGHDTLVRIANLPPPLVTYDCDVQCL